MNKGLGPKGYTIVETLIVLAVSSALLFSAMILISGQQTKAEFLQGSRGAESRIRDVANDVINGNYDASGLSCTVGASGPPTISVGGTNQGSNSGCAFIGKVMHFNSTDGTYSVHSVAGRQFLGTSVGSGNVSNLAEAEPIDLYPNPNKVERNDFGYGMKVVSIKMGNDNLRAFGFFTKFTNFGGGSNIQSAQLIGFPALLPSVLDDAQVAMAISALGVAGAPGYTDRKVDICLSGGRNQSVLIEVVPSGQQPVVKSTVKTGSAC